MGPRGVPLRCPGRFPAGRVAGLSSLETRPVALVALVLCVSLALVTLVPKLSLWLPAALGR